MWISVILQADARRAEAERLRFLAAVIADLLALIAKCGCVCADCDDGMSAPPALGLSP